MVVWSFATAAGMFVVEGTKIITVVIFLDFLCLLMVLWQKMKCEETLSRCIPAVLIARFPPSPKGCCKLCEAGDGLKSSNG